MLRYIFDCETDNLLADLTTVHCLVLKNIDTQEVITGVRESCIHLYHTKHRKVTVEQALQLMMEADLLVGHNVIKFDGTLFIGFSSL